MNLLAGRKSPVSKLFAVSLQRCQEAVGSLFEWGKSLQLVRQALYCTSWSDPVGLHLGNQTFILETTPATENNYPSSHPEKRYEPAVI